MFSLDLSYLIVVLPLIVAIFLPVAALISIWRRRMHMELTHVLIWGAIVIFAPVVGSLIWFLVGRSLHPSRRLGGPAGPPRVGDDVA